MRVIIQRVSEASVQINGQRVASIGHGLLLLLGIEERDEREDIEYLVPKIATMRIFADQEGKMNIDIRQAGGEILIVSQFTLHASTKKGNRPSFIRAARPEQAAPLYESFIAAMGHETGKQCAAGIFGANMQVMLVNNGPVTIVMDSRNRE
jgi:D-tyrosyl-tRNA(Tyr) deacylase